MSKVRIGIIGAGNIARLHARGYASAPNAELRAVCDANGERARERAAQWGAAKSYTDYRDLLDDPEVDAVDVITPHHLHARMGADALAAGKHVSMQKPMAVTVAECDELIAAADRAAGIFRTFENFQYYPPLVRGYTEVCPASSSPSSTEPSSVSSASSSSGLQNRRATLRLESSIQSSRNRIVFTVCRVLSLFPAR